MDETLEHLTAMLRHNQTIPALVLSQHLELLLGWDWTGAGGHLAGQYESNCQDEVALMATLLDDIDPAEGEIDLGPAAAAAASQDR